ncbi:MAG: class I SAM-dependent methyltransferase [Halioglobus sp.]
MTNKPETEREERDRMLFDSISDTYVSKDLTKSSRMARKLRLRQTLSLADVPASSVILEVGCGGGFAAEYLSGLYSKYYGVDYSEQLIDYALRARFGTNVNFEVCNINAYVPPEPVDVILMIGVLHHLDDIPGTLSLLHSMLSPSGVIVVNEPHPANILVSLLRRLRKVLDKNYSSDQVELTISEMENYYKLSGFKEIRIIPQGYFSTPFAEVILSPQFLASGLSAISCILDRALTKLPRSVAKYISWNVVAVGRK